MRIRLILFYVWLVAFPALHPVSAAVADPYDKSGVPLEVDARDGSRAKIVLLAGDPSSKPLGHEYFAGCALFADLLRQTAGVHPVIAWGGWPVNEGIFDNARCVVFYMDGGAKMPFLDDRRWSLLRRLEARGTGLVFLHQMIEFPESRRMEALGWLGAVFENGMGGRGHWESTFDVFPEHPVARGLKAFTINDGWLYGLRMAEDARARLTPILTTAPPDRSRTSPRSRARSGQEEIIAWCYERGNGGRSFAYSGADWHPNWEFESVRRVTINGILWAAGIDPPTVGASVALAPGALDRNLDRKVRATAGGIAKRLNPNVEYLAVASLPGITLDDLQGEVQGSWTGSSAAGPVIVGRNYLHDANKNKGDCAIVFRPEIPAAGDHRLVLYAQPHANRAPRVPVSVRVAGKDVAHLIVDQRDMASGARHELGVFALPAGREVEIRIENRGTTGVVVVDALQLVPLK